MWTLSNAPSETEPVIWYIYLVVPMNGRVTSSIHRNSNHFIKKEKRPYFAYVAIIIHKAKKVKKLFQFLVYFWLLCMTPLPFRQSVTWHVGVQMPLNGLMVYHDQNIRDFEVNIHLHYISVSWSQPTRFSSQTEHVSVRISQKEHSNPHFRLPKFPGRRQRYQRRFRHRFPERRWLWRKTFSCNEVGLV